MPRRWQAQWIYVSMCWWLYIWAVASFITIAGLRHDAQFFGVDFTGFIFFNGILCLIYIFFAKIAPSFWWLATLPWRLRPRPLAAVGVVAAVALWLAFLLVVIPRYYGPAAQLVSSSATVIAVVSLYRFACYRRRKRDYLAESALN